MQEERIIIPITFKDYEERAIEWAKTYANDIVTVEKTLVESNPYRYCVISLYKKFVKEKKLERIELINQESKTILFNKSKELFPDEVSIDLRRQLCIFLYFMNHLFETYFV